VKAIAGMVLEVAGAVLISYALYTVQPWAGLIAGGVFAILIGLSLGANK
jgi:hypothetical protein